MRKPRRPRRRPDKRPAPRWDEAIIVDRWKLLGWPNVERVALGWKERNGKVTKRIAVKIYTRTKGERLSPKDHVPKGMNVLAPIGKGLYKIRRVPTDVVWHAPATFCAGPGDYLAPVPSGAALGVPPRQSGTYTCLVADAAGRTFAVTAGHVIQGFPGTIAPEVQVLQPPVPPQEMPAGASPIFAQSAMGFFGNTPQGFVDCALLDISTLRSAVTDSLDGIPVRRQVMPAAVVINNRIAVTKFGAVTGRTQAIFSAIVTSIVIEGITVTNVLEFKGMPGKLFGTNGDSGALVVSANAGTEGLIVGILFATTPPTADAPAGRGYVMPFDRLTTVRPI